MTLRLIKTATIVDALLLCTLVVAGCGGAPESSELTTTDDTSEEALRAGARFACTAVDPTTSPDQVQVELGRGARSVTLRQQGASYRGTLDSSYKPTAPNRDFVRFQGFEELNDEFDVALLVHKGLLAGHNGRIKVVARGESFFSDVYDCTRN